MKFGKQYSGYPLEGTLLKADIHSQIKSVSTPKKLPDGTDYRSIAHEHVLNLANLFSVSGQEIEIAALETDIVPERYVRNLKSFSFKDQATLLRSQVSVVGLGGLGGAAVEILARSGIGNFILIDGDRFEESNLNRQFLSTHQLLNTSKAEVATNRVNQINSAISVQSYAEYLDVNNAARLIKNSDAIVDCLDNIQTRFVLAEAASKAGIPLVSAAVAGNSGHVTTIYPQDRSLELIYGQPDGLASQGAETSLGCLSPAVTFLAALESSEVLKILLKKGAVLRNKLLFVDLLDNTIEILDLI